MKQKNLIGHSAILVANIIFGLNTPISRSLIPGTLSPYTLTFLRMAGAVALFWTLSLFIKRERVPYKDIFLLLLASFFGIVLNQIPFIVGLSMTSPIDASIVITLLPILSMFLAAMIIKEPITVKKALGVLIGASGALLLIFSHENVEIGSGNTIGNLVILLGVFSYSLYLSLFKRLISSYSPITTMKWMFLFATIMSFPICYKDVALTDFSALLLNDYLRIGYVVIFATFIAYILIPVGQKVMRPTTISMYNYLQPIIASFVTIMLGMDIFRIEQLLSGVLVFVGVYFVTRSKSRAQMEAEKQNLLKGEQSVKK
ncbi:MAG: DMT family transporter [Bacteroidales bacterium]|jgi:drug/metabolite transporter (DMT)-like permease|nr:DMT family transporter [Bacteroidales bacterium]